MTLDEFTDFARTWLDCYTRGDVAGALACYTDDIEFEDPIFGESVHGRAALGAMFEGFFRSGVTRLAFDRCTGGAGGGAVEWTWTATWGPDRSFLGVDCSNRRFVVRGASILALRDGLISRQVDWWDARAALRQLGALA